MRKCETRENKFIDKKNAEHEGNIEEEHWMQRCFRNECPSRQILFYEKTLTWFPSFSDLRRFDAGGPCSCRVVARSWRSACSRTPPPCFDSPGLPTIQRASSRIEFKTLRSRQDSNLRGVTPLDFKSNALTTRPRLPLEVFIIK